MSERASLRMAVMVAHPGHELMIHHWMEKHRPLYCVLTDGSGSRGQARVESTTHVLQSVGATTGPIYGRYTDKELYEFLLAGRVDVFLGLVEELAAVLIDAGIDGIAGDPVEGFSPSHDVNRFIVDGAVAQVRRQTGRVMQNYEFALDAAPADCPEHLRDDAIWLLLDDAAVERKLSAAQQYPGLRDEVRDALERFGREAFAVECLRPANARAMLERFEREMPDYERWGQSRVEQGVYKHVIRYREHVFPVLAAIEEAGRPHERFAG